LITIKKEKLREAQEAVGWDKNIRQYSGTNWTKKAKDRSQWQN